MTWQNELPTIIRHLIDDVDQSTPSFSTERIKEAVLVSAQLVQAEITFNQTYTVDVDECTLSPDPTSGTKDNAFINLVCLKTACIISKGLWKAAIIGSLAASDGLSKIDTTSQAKYYKDMSKTWCDEYEDAKFEYLAGSLNPGKAILGPFSGPNLSTFTDYLIPRQGEY